MIAARSSRRKLINVVTLFFAACLVLFYGLARADVPLGVVFYLWVGIFNLMVIAQFWAFANDLYTPDQGKRLFAIVGFGASAGAVAGSTISSRLSGLGEREMLMLLLLAAGLLVVSLLVTNLVDARERLRNRFASPLEGTSATVPESAAAVEEPVNTGGPLRAFQLVVRHRYLLLIAFLILFLNWVNTTGEYILGRVVKESMEAKVAAGEAGGREVGPLIGAFYGDFFLWVNVISMLVQLFLVSRILKYLGVRIALLILPVIALGGYLTIMIVPLLGLVRWVKTGENATDYSLQNTLRGVLFLPTTREQKYMGKQAIDTIFVRAGDTLQALTVWVGTTFLAFGTREFAAFNAGLVLIWIGLALAIGKRYRQLTADR
jgi:AAA family ATP:ADP antiporter